MTDAARKSVSGPRPEAAPDLLDVQLVTAEQFLSPAAHNFPLPGVLARTRKFACTAHSTPLLPLLVLVVLAVVVPWAAVPLSWSVGGVCFQCSLASRVCNRRCRRGHGHHGASDFIVTRPDFLLSLVCRVPGYGRGTRGTVTPGVPARGYPGYPVPGTLHRRDASGPPKTGFSGIVERRRITPKILVPGPGTGTINTSINARYLALTLSHRVSVATQALPVARAVRQLCLPVGAALRRSDSEFGPFSTNAHWHRKETDSIPCVLGVFGCGQLQRRTRPTSGSSSPTLRLALRLSRQTRAEPEAQVRVSTLKSLQPSESHCRPLQLQLYPAYLSPNPNPQLS
eukprot:2860884-Rhodomonas_salina.3